MANLKDTFPEMMRRGRRNRRMSQQALADRVGVTRKMVNEWETGRRWPRFDRGLRVCAALYINPQYIKLSDNEELFR